jgi:2-haloacid dehalogenase
MATRPQPHEQNSPALETVRAVVFDVQGTCVDFYQPILRMGEAVNQAKDVHIDWAALSTEWRDLYREALDQVIAGQRPWLRVDHIYREALDMLLERRELSRLFTAAERDDLNQIWCRLDPWPDSVAGLAQLRRRFTTSTLSNAGMAAVIAVVRVCRSMPCWQRSSRTVTSRRPRSISWRWICSAIRLTRY